MTRGLCFILAGLTALHGAGCDKPSESRRSRAITVFAAASTTDVLREAGRLFEAETGMKVVFSFDASSSLARQIREGAPADVFISADTNWMDEVIKAGEMQEATRATLLANSLVLIAPAGRPIKVEMTREFEFTSALPDIRRIAVGDPAHVPAGRYARQALESLGWWESLQPLLIPAMDVRAAQRLVELGEADLGIVYATHAKALLKASVVAIFPADLHAPIEYPLALCKDAATGAADFVNFLRSPRIRQLFEDAGFRVSPAVASGVSPL